MPKVTLIPSYHQVRKKRVAAYCRVSTDKANQEESFETQVEYYTRLIRSNPNWVLERIYADQGCSATSTKNRTEFLQLIADAMAGKIDIILVKSISRFSRNIVDCHTHVDMLRAKGVEVRFEKEHISTLDASSDMIFSLMAAIAQDESKSISENVRWGCQKRAEMGICHLGCNRVLGYDEIDGALRPNQDAWIVKTAFDLFLRGLPFSKIAAEITSRGGKRMRGKTPFDGRSISAILHNEIYVGDRNMGKTPPRDYLTKKTDQRAHFNTYYWKDVHEGIIDRETWEKVETILDKRRQEVMAGVQKKGKKTHFLYGVVFCGICGAPMKRRTLSRSSSAKGEYIKAWNCRNHFKGETRCENTFIKEEVLCQTIANQIGVDVLTEQAVADMVLRVEVDKGTVCTQRKKVQGRTDLGQ